MNKTILCLFSFLFAATTAVLAQGNLAPSAAPAPSMKTLDQIEPRTPISTLPFVITNAGSYYLATNLVSGSANGIVISNNDVTLDLRGFTISGGASSQQGILVSGARTNIAVENGTVRNFPISAVNGQSTRNSQFRNLRASNSGYGLEAGPGSLVTDCTFTGNTNAGVSASFNCIITSCSALSNRFDGISAFTGALISNCTAGFNGRDGIVVTTQASISDCISKNNTNGIRVASNSYIRNNALSDNLYCGILVTGSGNRIDSNILLEASSDSTLKVRVILSSEIARVA